MLLHLVCVNYFPPLPECKTWTSRSDCIVLIYRTCKDPYTCSPEMLLNTVSLMVLYGMKPASLMLSCHLSSGTKRLAWLLNLHQLSSLLSRCHTYTHTAPTLLGYSAIYVQPCNKLCYRLLTQQICLHLFVNPMLQLCPTLCC